MPDTGTLRGDAIAFLQAANNSGLRAITMLSVQLAQYFQDDDSTLGELRAALRPQHELGPFETIIQRARHRGELNGVPLSTRVINVAFDLLRHESLMHRIPTSDVTIEQIVDELWLPLVKPDHREDTPKGSSSSA